MTEIPDRSVSPDTPQVTWPKEWLYNPFLHVFIAVFLTAVAQILLKIGAESVLPTENTFVSWAGIQELTAGWTWLGITALVASFGSWLYALRFLPLGLAFNLTNGVHVLVPVGSWLFLHEKIGTVRLAGITLIIAGIVFLAQTVAKVEEKV